MRVGHLACVVVRGFRSMDAWSLSNNYATWRPMTPLAITPSPDIASDRWSDMTTNPVQAFPYIETGASQLLGVDATYSVSRNLDLAAGGKNLLDQNYELAWGYPQPGRTFYLKTRVKF